MSDRHHDSYIGLRDPSSWLRRVILVVAGMLLLAAAWVLLQFGACHSRGGFCASEFQNDHGGMLVIAVLLAAVGGWTLVSAAARALVPRIVSAAVTATVAVAWSVTTLP